jgi:hypothetical protein
VSSILNIKKLITSLLFLLKSVSDDVNTVTITGLTGEIVDEFDNLLSNLSCMSYSYSMCCFSLISNDVANEALDFKISTFNLIKIVVHRIKAKVAKVPFLGIPPVSHFLAFFCRSLCQNWKNSTRKPASTSSTASAWRYSSSKSSSIRRSYMARPIPEKRSTTYAWEERGECVDCLVESLCLFVFVNVSFLYVCFVWYFIFSRYGSFPGADDDDDLDVAVRAEQGAEHTAVHELPRDAEGPQRLTRPATADPALSRSVWRAAA